MFSIEVHSILGETLPIVLIQIVIGYSRPYLLIGSTAGLWLFDTETWQQLSKEPIFSNVYICDTELKEEWITYCHGFWKYVGKDTFEVLPGRVQPKLLPVNPPLCKWWDAQILHSEGKFYAVRSIRLRETNSSIIEIVVYHNNADKWQYITFRYLDRLSIVAILQNCIYIIACSGESGEQYDLSSNSWSKMILPSNLARSGIAFMSFASSETPQTISLWKIEKA